MDRDGRNAKEAIIQKTEVMGLGDCARNVGRESGPITYEVEAKPFNRARGMRLYVAIPH